MGIGFGLSSRNWWRAQGGGGAVADDRFIISVKTDNAGTSASNQFTIPTSTSGITQAFNYDIETSDGQTITGNTGNTTITFPSAGTYDIKISGSFPYMYFNNGGDRLKLLDIKNFGIYALGSTNQHSAFRGCSNMDITATDSGNFGSVTGFDLAWAFCSSLTSFPLIDTSSGISFIYTWYDCSSLTSFPLIDTSSGTNISRTWERCLSLTSFPANAFDTNIATNYSIAFTNTNLTTQSIDDILVSLDTSGVSNGTFTQSGGQAPSATGEAAIDSLVGKGWTITVTGGYTPPQLLLDEYPNSAAAYSLRELSTAFVGQPVVRVRRSDNNAEQDFTATEITDGTLTTFTGANDGFVTTWYDQSGNSNNVIQASASFQPKLVSNGTLILENGKPVLEMEKARRTGMQIDFTPTVITQPLSLFFLIKKDSHSVSFLYYPLSGLGIAQPSANYISAGVNLLNAFPDTELNKQIIFTNFYNTTNSSAYINSNVTVTGDAGTNNVSNLVLGSGLGYQRSINGFFQELIIYPSDQSTNRTGIETNINNEYNIY